MIDGYTLFLAISLTLLWIEPEHIDRILTDDGYSRITEGTVEIGDVVLYKNNVGEYHHVGLVVKKELELVTDRKIQYIGVLSKWGSDGEYFHRVDDLPQMLAEEHHCIEYWSDRHGDIIHENNI